MERLQGAHLISLNLVFHVLSAVVFGWLIYELAKAAALRRFSRLLWRSLMPNAKGEAVYVEWPGVFIARFCQEVGLPLERSLSNLKTKEMARILPRVLVELIQAVEIKAMRLEANSHESSIKVVIIHKGSLTETKASEWQKKLEFALDHKATFTFSESRRGEG